MASAPYKLITKKGYPLDEATSALIKSLRRSDEELALFFGLEILESFPGAFFKRLAVFAVEDVGLADPNAIVVIAALWYAYDKIRKIQGKGRPVEGDLGVMGLLYLGRAPKHREVDAAKNYMEERREAGFKPEIPDYALDCHTERGRKTGKTESEYWQDCGAWLPPGGFGKYEWYARLKKWGGKLPDEPAGRAK